MEKHAISIDRIIFLPTQENTQGLHRSSQNTSMEMLNIMKAWTLNHSCTCFPTRRTSSQDLLIYLCMYMYYIYHTNTRNIKMQLYIYRERDSTVHPTNTPAWFYDLFSDHCSSYRPNSSSEPTASRSLAAYWAHWVPWVTLTRTGTSLTYR